VPILRHISTHYYIACTSGATRTHTSAACGVDTTYATPYRLVEPVQLIEMSSSEEDPEGDPEELSPEPTMDAPDLPEDDEDPFPDVDSLEDIMPAPEADSTEESGPGGMTNSDDSSSQQTTP